MVQIHTRAFKIEMVNNMSDELHKRTHKDYTSWDLNCQRYVNVRNRQKLEALFKRKARREMKRELAAKKRLEESGET